MCYYDGFSHLYLKHVISFNYIVPNKIKLTANYFFIVKQ